MIDFKVLEACGTTNARLKEVFTAKLPANINDLDDDAQKRIQRDVALRKKLEECIAGRLTDRIGYNLTNHLIYSAVDVAWDGQPINKAIFPLMLYAQGKLNIGSTASSLQAAGFGKYVAKDDKGVPIGVDMPKFYETQVNLIRSILARRLAAQSNKYSNLFPYYKYESRSTSLVGKLRADVMSQISDIMTDNFDYRHHDVQCYRDVFLYGHVVDFITCAWEKQCQWKIKVQPEGLEPEKPEFEEEIVKEGLTFTNPHPSRVGYDNSYALASLNTDTGLEWIFYWDVKRYKDFADDMRFWNRDQISYSSGTVGLFTQYAAYFSQYFCVVTPPTMPPCDGGGDLSSANDRKNQVGTYNSNEGDAAVIFSVYFQKLVPNDYDLGTYPYPVWVRYVVAGDCTVIQAEFLPSTPGVYGGYNENDARQLNISVAHELMAYQDQMTNLLSYLLLVMQANNVRVMIVDTDVASADQVKAFRAQLKGESAYTGTTVLEVSRSKMEELGIDPTKVLTLVETKPIALDVIFRAIAQLVSMVERMMALSPQEQGQPAPREISATETNLIAGTTQSVYDFISDSFDEFRAAKKRLIYESFMALGNQKFRVPVMERYSPEVIQAAGFQAQDGEFEHGSLPAESLSNDVMRYTVIGTKEKLQHDYIFTSRDGAERPVNTQSAATLVQLLNILKDPAVMSGMSKEQFYEIINEVFRMSGAGVDVKLQAQEGDSPGMMPPQNDEMQQHMLGMADAVKKNTDDVAQMQQMMQSMGAAPSSALPQQQPNPQGQMAVPELAAA